MNERRQAFLHSSARAVGPLAFLRTVITTPWRGGVWKQTLHLLLDFPIGFTGLVYALATVLTVGLAALGTGLPLLGGWVLGGRGWAWLERRRVRVLLAERVTDPAPFRPTRPGFGGWVRAAVADRAGWRGIAYLTLLGLWSLVATTFTIAFWLPALLLVTYPIWHQPFTGFAGQPGIQLGVSGSWRYVDSSPEVAAAMVAGVVLAHVSPFVVRGLTQVDRALARGLLASHPLAQRVRELERSRRQAVGSATDERRRIERDLHDGAQVHMVAVAMNLGMARAKMAADPEAAAELITKAHQEAKRAIAELRRTARGIHPAILTDRGLDGSLPTLTASCAVPVDLTVTIDERPAEAIEAIAYYSVAELLTNVSKHAGATRASVMASRRGDTLLVEVMDDGVGGASARGGGGLRGIAERLRPVDGTMTISSPLGGPTTVRLELPCVS